MLVALKPKPMLPVAADAGAASRNRAAASTAGTSAMAFVFIFQAFLPVTGNRWRTEPETQRLLRPSSQLLDIKHEHLSRRTGERRPGCLVVATSRRTFTKYRGQQQAVETDEYLIACTSVSRCRSCRRWPRRRTTWHRTGSAPARRRRLGGCRRRSSRAGDGGGSPG